MTIGPGDEIFEKFGHNLIRIIDHSTGDDIVYNWGVFDFNQPNFYLNFAMGRPRYWMQSDPYDAGRAILSGSGSLHLAPGAQPFARAKIAAAQFMPGE